MAKGRTRTGTGRAAGPTSIRLPSDLSEFLRSRAQESHSSVASLILHLVQNWKDDEEAKLWEQHTARFCDQCRPHLVDLLYRKQADGSYQRRYNTPPLRDAETKS